MSRARDLRPGMRFAVPSFEGNTVAIYTAETSTTMEPVNDPEAAQTRVWALHGDRTRVRLDFPADFEIEILP